MNIKDAKNPPQERVIVINHKYLNQRYLMVCDICGKATMHEPDGECLNCGFNDRFAQISDDDWD